ncbi:MMPL family transporter [Streptacidiphilus anmyonensis]|uniref:MMPL family transporter n=1 Tax=Streptacidiphilus anmyonensis TaxID=405782 RepID=UPI0005AA3C13|nr:MMPL family transporter [Streptacidiphilus anmyonensis]
MFHRIGRVVVRHPFWTLVAWIVAAVAIAASAPTLTSNSDESSFLPKSYESIQAMELQQSAFPHQFTPGAEILFQRADGKPLGPADKAQVATINKELSAKTDIPLNQGVITAPFSKDGLYGLGMVNLGQNQSDQNKMSDAAKAIRADVADLTKGSSLTAKVGGSAAQVLDQADSNKTGQAIIGLGTFVIIILAMLLIFRSPLMAVLPIALIGVVLVAANGLIADVTKALNLSYNASVSGILIVVLFGVGTDYILFLMFRYRERLRAGDDHKEAMINAVGRVGEAIASAAGTVIIAFLALCLSSISFLKQMGPSLAISVGVTLLAGLTLVPAVFSWIPPRVLFWPSKKWRIEPEGSRFAAVGNTVKRRPALVAVVSGVLMVAIALVATTYKASFDFASGSMPKTVESMVVQDTIAKAYSAGAATPTDVFVTSSTPLDQSAVQGLASKLDIAGVSSVAPAKYNPQGTTADISVVLSNDPQSSQAMDTVGKLRDVVHANAPNGTKAMVGGVTAIYADIQKAIDRDYSVVFPVAAVLIMLILGLMLRSVVAPWYLMASVGLGFAATLGATVLVFQHLDHQSGLMFMLPVFIYLFVVAIGTDYNILMISRLREEAREGREPREAAAQALRHAGPTVAAAGAILAGTFASMMLAGNSLFAEMGFSIAIGIVIAAFVMAMFFTPSLTALVGHAAWWPGHADRRKESGGSRVVASSAGAHAQDDELDSSRR